MARCFQWTFLFPVDSLGSQKAREKFQKYGIIYPATPLCFSSFRFSHLVVSDSLRHHELQHARPLCPSPTPGVHSDPRHRVSDAIQPSHPLSSPSPPAPQSFPAAESFPMSQLFAWAGLSTGVSALASFLPKNTQD